MTQQQGIGMTSQRTRDRLIERLRTAGIRDERILQVMRNTPRHLFMDEAIASRAYEDTALPIGHGQTISQPYVVARMTEALLADQSMEKVLEIGTGSGYQTAILAQLCETVYSVERIYKLQAQARGRLEELGIRNAFLHHSDGLSGWQAHAPYDGILVTAAPQEVPEALLYQLQANGGRMVIPVGTQGAQELQVITRNGDQLDQAILDQVSFVPLLGGIPR